MAMRAVRAGWGRSEIVMPGVLSMIVVHARGLLQRADVVAPRPMMRPSRHWQGNDGHRGLRHMVGGALLRLAMMLRAFCCLPGVLLNRAPARGVDSSSTRAMMARGFLGGQARDALQLARLPSQRLGLLQALVMSSA